MKVFDPEWREANRELQELLRPYLKSCDMGASRYESKDRTRAVSVKHRMRKDKNAVVSLGCWEQGSWDEEKDYYSYVRPVFFVTAAMPDAETCKRVGSAFLEFLEGGEFRTLNFELSTYRGYEDFDRDARNRDL